MRIISNTTSYVKRCLIKFIHLKGFTKIISSAQTFPNFEQRLRLLKIIHRSAFFDSCGNTLVPSGISFSHEKVGNPTICNNMNKTGDIMLS